MKAYLLLIVILLSLVSCDQVIFPEPQPRKVKPLKEIPTILQGVYLDQDGDTLNVYNHSFSYDSDEYTSLKNTYLSDSAVLKKYKEYFFFNTPLVLGEERFWISYILYMNEDGSGFDLYAMDPDDIVKLAKLQEITSKVQDIEKTDRTFYLFKPGKKDYKKIISDTIFTKMISFDKL